VAEPALVKIVEDWKSAIAFWAAMVSTASGVLSAVGLFVRL
jgi:hypothetical protein